MTLGQLAQVKHWLLMHAHQHAHQHAVELQAWNLVLGCWVLGWTAMPGVLLLQVWWLLPLLPLGVLLPSLYVAWRSRLHRRGRLRCDWLCAL